MLQTAVVLGAGYGALEYLMRSIVHARKEVEVPDLRNRPLNQAITIVSRLGLAMAKEADEYAPDLPAGAILKQHPLPGAKVREGKIIRVAVSLGSEKIAVPELIGMPLRKAEIEIRTAQLALGETAEIYSLKQPKSYVVDQDPKPLGLAEKGELINLTISLGEPPADKLIVPDFTNKDAETAIAWANNNGLGFRVHEEWNAAGAADRNVLKQNLKPDAVLDKNSNLTRTTLELTVARNLSSSPEGPVIEFTLPAKPLRDREVVFKMLGKGGEKQIFHGRAGPGEKVRAPVGQIAAKEQARIRIYLDGVFTEERTLK